MTRSSTLASPLASPFTSPLVLASAVVLAACSTSAPRGVVAGVDAGSAGEPVDAGTPPVPPQVDASMRADAEASVDTGTLAPGLGDAALDPPSHGATITFQSIGAAGWFPSRRDPAIGPCDAYESSTCCLATDTITSNALTPWDEDLILTLRGPAEVAQLAVYQPAAGTTGPWDLVSRWDPGQAASAQGIAFDGNGTEQAGFPGSVGTECLVNVSTDQTVSCGPGSSPYCPLPPAGHHAYRGWSGSKLFVILATMPHAPLVAGACSTTTTGNWYDAPWIGLSVGELVRAGSFVACQCYAKDPTKGYLADGCGQFNVFEVVNDNNSYKNLDVFSTDMIDYAGYVGEGPCGPACGVANLGAGVDLIDKSTDTESTQGAVSSPTQGPGAAFRRPEVGYRYFVILLDVPSRTVALAMIHPLAIPAAVSGLLPGLPTSIDAAIVDAVRALRLPK
jgi:hypothetical protein